MKHLMACEARSTTFSRNKLGSTSNQGCYDNAHSIPKGTQGRNNQFLNKQDDIIYHWMSFESMKVIQKNMEKNVLHRYPWMYNNIEMMALNITLKFRSYT